MIRGVFQGFSVFKSGIFFLSIFVGSFPQNSLGWGERGHHLGGRIAAHVVQEWLPRDQKSSAVIEFFEDRDIAFGHLSNIPDTSWKNRVKSQRVYDVGMPHHYFGPERILGVPGNDFSEFLEQIRKLPADYTEIRSRYHGKQSPLPGAEGEDRKIDFYQQVGVTPWRAQELYDLLAEAFKCAKAKEKWQMSRDLPGSYPSVEDPFDHPEKAKSLKKYLSPNYVCQRELGRKSDLYAAVVLAGVLGHFIQDQAQPYHPTADYDGWVTGNGGIHSYFESQVVQALDQKLASDVLKTAQNPLFRETLWEKVGTEVSAPNGVARLLIHLAADSQSYIASVREIDDTVAIKKERSTTGHVSLQKSTVVPWGERHWGPGKKSTKAKRLSANDPKVLKAFRPVIVERIAASTVLLSRLWVEAWKQGGEPDLSTENAVSLPYPLDPPFIWPTFEPSVLKVSSSLSGRDSDEELMSAEAEFASGNQYPKRWWKKYPRENDWEILPHTVRPPKVILSKRNELGILSNFAATPFEYRGKEYASIEGFWQAMKYPEGPNDPRANYPGVKWPYTRAEVEQMIGFEAKDAGKIASANMKKMKIRWITFEGKRIYYRTKDQKKHFNLIYSVSWAKVKQNPEVKKILLRTGNLELLPDHVQAPDSPPAYRYYEIYMDIREKLRQRLGLAEVEEMQGEEGQDLFSGLLFGP